MKNPVIVALIFIILIGGFLGITVRPAGAATMVKFEGQITTAIQNLFLGRVINE